MPQEILTGVREQLTSAAADARLPPWPLAATAASGRAAVFLAARFGKALRLLASIAAFSGVLAPQELQQLAFDNVIRRQVAPRSGLAHAVCCLSLQSARMQRSSIHHGSVRLGRLQSLRLALARKIFIAVLIIHCS